MSNFIPMVYATLKKEGIDTKGMSTDEAVAKFQELQKKSGGKVGEKEGTPAEQKKLAEQEKTEGKEKKGINLGYLGTIDKDGNIIDNPNEKGYKDFKNEDKEIKKGKIDYDNVKYPEGTSKEFTMRVNEKYELALPVLDKLGIKEEDFGGKRAKEGGFEDNTEEIMNKYVFEPFNKKYPKGNNDAWDKEYQPIYDAIEAVADKHYNDYWILNK